MTSLTTTLLSHETAIRFGVFMGLFFAIALWEVLAPWRRTALSRWRRWPNNLGIAALNAAVVRITLPVTAISTAAIVEQHGWGMMTTLELPVWLAVITSILLLDFVIYFQHRLFHAVPSLWRLHRMHHADLEFDVTTGARFHPIEILISMVIKLASVTVLGAPALAVLIFEVLLNATSMFNHGNIVLPPKAEGVLRWWVVTPEIHRIHHSIAHAETNSNFGFNLPWWDRLFATYRAEPAAGRGGVAIGIPMFREPGELRLDRMLLQPFRYDLP
ncbi:MAG: sterol desaturase family protein [Gammaproteobacteria bacterium]|nr:sterol desaturase family protein [Gammaproteobacteria bacterium]